MSLDVMPSLGYSSSNEDDTAPLPMLPAPLRVAPSVARHQIEPRNGPSSLGILNGEESVPEHVSGHVSGQRNSQEGRGADAKDNKPKNMRINMGKRSADINPSLCVRKPLPLEIILN